LFDGFEHDKAALSESFLGFFDFFYIRRSMKMSMEGRLKLKADSFEKAEYFLDGIKTPKAC